MMNVVILCSKLTVNCDGFLKARDIVCEHIRNLQDPNSLPCNSLQGTLSRSNEHMQYHPPDAAGQFISRNNSMARPRKQRRNPHGSAWHWNQTDCWYYTFPGTKKRVPLFDEDGSSIRGRENQEAAENALARLKVAGAVNEGQLPDPEWVVARVCSEYVQHCEKRVAASSMSKSHRDGSVAFLNDLCGYCGALPVAELKKSHLQTWIESHAGWRSQATHRGVITIILAAFNRAEEMFDVPNPLKGLKKSPLRSVANLCKSSPYRLFSLTISDLRQVHAND